MTADDLVRGVVRIWSDGDAPTVVGTGVLVAPGLVLTCAHVAARAWGEPPELEDGLGRTLRLDLPAAEPDVRRDATVVFWRARRRASDGGYDLAGLRVVGAAPAAGLPLPLVVDDAPWGTAVRAFGFPPGRPDGAYASGVLRDVLANGWTMVKGGADAREFARPGFSGGPVTTGDGVVGLLTEGDSDVRVREALMVPVRAILGAWPELHERVARSPFPGLAPFTADDTPRFFGRERAVAELTLAAAAPPHLVLLAGPSGSGKSSLVAAGVLPALAAGRGPDGRAWRTLTWSPGPAPFAAFAKRLLRAGDPAADDARVAVDAARLAADLEAGHVALADLLGQDDDARWAIAVDQPETLLIEDASAPERASRSRRLFDLLLDARDDERLQGRLAVVVCVRTDVLDGLLRLPPLARHASEGLVRYLGPVDDLRAVVEAPLRTSGLGRLEAGLTERLLADVAGVPNPLPLLQFTLAELWRQRRAGRLTHEAYDALGGVRQALANHAERLVAGFAPADLVAAREVLLQLGRPGADDTVARRSARLDELGDRGRRVVARLADARLVVTDRDAEGVERVDVVHEALFAHWPRLRGWWREAADFRRWQEGLRFAIRVWDDAGRHPSDLLQGPRLRDAEAHLQERPDAFGPEELAFVLRSAAHEQAVAEADRQGLRRQLRFRRRMNVLLGIGMAAAAVLAVVTLRQTAAVRASRAEVEALLQTTSEANAALGQLTAELERSLGSTRTVLARQLGIQAVAMANDPATFGSGRRLAALLGAYAVRLDPGPASYDHLLRALLAQPTYRAALADDATAVALDHAGRVLAVGDRLGGVRLVDATTGAALGGRLEGHAGPVTALAFAGERLVSGGADGVLVRWSTAPWRREDPFAARHAGPVAAVATTVDDRVLVSSDLTGELRSWDARSGAALAVRARQSTADQATQPVRASDPEPGEVAARDAAGTPAVPVVRDAGIPVLVGATDGLDREAAAGHRAWAAALATHPERPLVAVALHDGVAVLDAATLAPVWRTTDPAGGDAAGVAFAADGAAVVAVSETGTVRRWTLGSPGEPTRWFSGVAGVRAVAPRAHGDRVLLGTAQGTAVWFDLATGRLDDGPLRGHDGDVTGLAVAGPLVLTASADGRAVTWDAIPPDDLGSPIGVAGAAPHALVIDDAGAVAYVGSGDGSLTRLPLAAPGAATAVAAHEGGVYGAVFAGGRLATVGRDGRLTVRDPVTLEVLATPYVHDDLLWSLAADPQGEAWLAGGIRGLVVRVPWDADRPSTVWRAASRGWSPGALVAHSGRDLWAAAFESRLELWRGDVLLERTEHPTGHAVIALAFDPGGTRLLASTGVNVTLFAVPTLEPVAAWPDAGYAALAHDGAVLAHTVAQGVQLRDGASHATIGPPFRGHAALPTRLAFTRDGRWLVTADPTGAVRRWPTHPEAWLDHACAVAWEDLTAEEVTALLGGHAFEPPCEADGA